MEKKNAIAYYRASTARQGESGLGIEAQRQAVNVFSTSHGFRLTEEFIEIEHAQRKARPGLLRRWRRASAKTPR